MKAPLPYGPFERDLCRKAGDDVLEAVKRTLALCDTSGQRTMVAIYGAIAAMSMAAEALRDHAPELRKETDDAIMGAVFLMMRGAREHQERGA